MKKLLLILILAMTVMASSCNKKVDTDVTKDPQVVEENDKEVSEEKPDNKTNEEEETVYKNYPKGEIIEEQLVYDQDNIKVKAKSIFYEDSMLSINFEFENNTEEEKTFVLDYLIINGYEIDMYNEIVVFPNRKGILTEFLSFDVLETIKSKEIIDLKSSIGVRDEDYNTKEMALVDVKTKFSDKEYTPPHKNGKVLYKDGKFELIGLGLIKQSESLYYTLAFVNNTDENVTINIENHTVNGFNVYGYGFAYANKGNTTIMNVSLDKEVLELFVEKDFQGKRIDVFENPDQIKEILFTLRLSEKESYEVILKEALKMELE